MTEQNYTEYPRPQQSEPISFNVIGEAWRLLWRNPWPYITASACGGVIFLAVVTAGMFALFPTLIELVDGAQNSLVHIIQMQLSTQLAMLVFVFMAGAVSAPFFGSICYMAQREAIDGVRAEMRDVFWGHQNNFLAFSIAGFLFYLSTTIGSYLCYLPGFLAGGLFLLTFPMLAQRSPVLRSPIEAMRRSWITMKSHIWLAAVMYFLLSMIMGVGGLACFVGVFISVPLGFIASSLVFRDLDVSGAVVYQPRYPPPYIPPTPPEESRQSPPNEPPVL